jgi:hypothetical protein
MIRLYTSPKEMKQKIMVGNLTVWSILLVSLLVSIYYWYQISGITTANEKIGAFEKILLWSSVAIGFLSELVKKVTLSTIRNKKIWVFATIVSIITVMGSFAILDQNRSVALKKGSDFYAGAVGDKKEAQKEMARFAHMEGITMADLDAKEADNVLNGGSNKARNKSKMTYRQFVDKRDEIIQEKKDLRGYLSAKNMVKLAKNDMTGAEGSGVEISNPLFGQIKTVTGFTISAITLTFFLAVTLLLEISAFYIGGEIQEFKNFLYLTEAELLDIQNMTTFGISFRQIERDKFSRVMDAMRDQTEADALIINMRANRVDANGNSVGAGEVSQNVRNVRSVAEDNHRQARNGQYVIAGSLDLEGYTLEELRNRRDNVDMSSDNPICPACNNSFSRISPQDVFCHPDHRQEFNNQLRRLRRAS